MLVWIGVKMNRRILYNKKGYWKRQFTRFDLSVLQLLNFERSGALDIPLIDYVSKGHESIKLGLTGEEILDKLVKHGFDSKTIAEVRNMINMVEVCSVRLKEVAESKWGQELDSFPVFKSSTATVGELIEQSNAVREMNKLLEMTGE